MCRIVSLLANRREEIQAIEKLWDELSRTLGEESAVKVLVEAITAEAQTAGRRAAEAEPGLVGLAHFTDVFKRRYCDGGIYHKSAVIEGDELTMDIARCDYPRLYRESNLPAPIIHALTCGGEEPFARGYDHRLQLSRWREPAGGNRDCRLVYHWDAAAEEDPVEKGRSLRLLHD